MVGNISWRLISLLCNNKLVEFCKCGLVGRSRLLFGLLRCFLLIIHKAKHTTFLIEHVDKQQVIKLRTPDIQRIDLPISFAASTLPLLCIYCEIVCFAEIHDTKNRNVQCQGDKKAVTSRGKIELVYYGIHKFVVCNVKMSYHQPLRLKLLKEVYQRVGQKSW